MAGLGHREAAHQLPGDQVAQVGVVVRLGAELEDRAAEEPELHADLHQHRQVAVRQRLERGDRGADVAAAAVLLREAHPGLAGRGHLDHDVLDPLAEVVDATAPRPRRGSRRTRRGWCAPGCGLGVLAVEQRGQGRYVDLGLDVSGLHAVPRCRWPWLDATHAGPRPKQCSGPARCDLRRGAQRSTGTFDVVVVGCERQAVLVELLAAGDAADVERHERDHHAGDVVGDVVPAEVEGGDDGEAEVDPEDDWSDRSSGR